MTVKQTHPIAETVAGWDGVTSADNGRMGTAFTVGKIELGHMHGDHVVHMPMPKRLRDELIDAGRATPHPVMPESGWIQLLIATAGDAANAIELFRQNYERARNRGQQKGGRT